MIRTVVEERSKNIAVLDVFSKLSQNRILYIESVIDDELANGIVAQLLYLDSLSHEEITIIINSPGGFVYQGLAIIDAMNKVKSPIKTYATGCCASMAAVILVSGDIRQASTYATIMMHQPSSWAAGKFTDMEITLEEVRRLKDLMYNIIGSKCNVTPEMMKDDLWLNSNKALELGIIDEIN